MLGKRGDELDAWDTFLVLENYFSKSESISAPSAPKDGWTNVGQPLQPIPEGPEEWSPMSSPGHESSNPESLTGSGYELMEGDAPPRASSLAWSTMSDAVPELAGEHAPPNPGLSTESGHLLTGVDAPLSTSVFPTWFHPDHADYGLMGTHASRPNLGPSDPRPSTKSDSDHRLVVEEPPSIPALPKEFDTDHESEGVHPPPRLSNSESDHEILYTAPSSSVSSINSGRRSKGAGSVEESSSS